MCFDLICYLPSSQYICFQHHHHRNRGRRHINTTSVDCSPIRAWRTAKQPCGALTALSLMRIQQSADRRNRRTQDKLHIDYSHCHWYIIRSLSVAYSPAEKCEVSQFRSHSLANRDSCQTPAKSEGIEYLQSWTHRN